MDSNRFCNDNELSFWLNDTIHEIRHHGQQFLKDSMLGSCPTQEGVNTKTDRLGIKRLLRSKWLLQDIITVWLLQSKDAIRD